MGVKADEIPRLVEKAKVASSMRGNPIVLTDEELTAIARAALT
jgi:alcohol dehydrogenase class IV